MRHCPKCNAEMEEGKTYCGRCGYDEKFASPSGDRLVTAGTYASDNARSRNGSQTPNEDLTAQARAALKGNWGLAVGTFFLYMLIINLIGAIPFLGTVAMLLIAGPFALGITQFSLNLSRGTEPKLEQIFDGFKRFGTALGAYWLMLIFILLWSLLLIIHGIIKALAYSLTYMIIADDKNIEPLAAIRKSQEMMQGNKAKLFFFFLRFFGWLLLCVLTFGIGLLWLIPYVAVSFAKFYDDVKV